MLVKDVFQDKESGKWAFIEYATDSSDILYNIGNKEFDTFDEANAWRDEYFEKQKTSRKSVSDVLKERSEQINIRGYSIKSDKEVNTRFQLLDAAKKLLFTEFKDHNANIPPFNWHQAFWEKIINKTYRERLVKSAAFILAEIDRIDD